MMFRLFSFLLLLMVSPLVMAEEALEVPFHMPQPEGWKSETISFPLEFAPQLEFEGLEELRFAPGMLDPEAEDFWSYSFVWWLPAETVFSAEGLSRDLEAYYKGLTRAVAKSKDYDPENPNHRVEMRTVSQEPKRFVGLVETFDAFTTREPIYLMLRGQVVDCSAAGNIAIVFELSPQPESHAVWKSLGEIIDGFRCSR